MSARIILFRLWLPAIFLCSSAMAQPKPTKPIDYVKLVADRVISNAAFKLRATVSKPQQAFQQIETVDFGRSFNASEGVGYAYSVLESDENTEIFFQLSFSGAAKIWINEQVVFEEARINQLDVKEHERAWKLSNQFKASLQKGANKILIKSHAPKSQEWKVMLQPLLPMPEEGDVTKNREPLKFRLSADSLITKEVADISNWIVIGPFQKNLSNKTEQIKIIYPPEEEFIIGKLYTTGNTTVTWQLPKIELVTDVFDAHPLWGSLYDWNYHTAGLAWAIGNLGAYTDQQVYKDYLLDYCNFMLDKRPYIFYEKYAMNRLTSRFSRMWHTELLDFSTAPGLPFVYSILSIPSLPNLSEYEGLVNATKKYLLNSQLRLTDGTLVRETPLKYTLWVDDMFMGVPFLLQAARYAKSDEEKQALLNDAARQIIQFHKRLYDPEVNLYHHAWYSERPEAKLPYWSRANGWGVWAASEVLLYLPEKHPLYKNILSIYRKHMAGIVKCQDSQTGFYPNLLDEPNSFRETSGTAIFTMAIARGINHGWLPRNTYQAYARKGWTALTSVISEEGEVSGICMGTMCSEDKNYYRNRPLVKNDSHGLLGLVFAGIEMQKLLDAKAD
ncbi:MAG: glycoside hydrolase family 88 protein [Gemmatimonadaceae bacterium]|nr:glycoside hydrolase family 88 protein [Chitinophagaceae bacterium]